MADNNNKPDWLTSQTNNYGTFDLNNNNQNNLNNQSTVTTLNPQYNNRISELLNTIQQRINNTSATDITQDPRYKSMQSLMQKNVKDAQRQAMETMNAKGLFQSDLTRDRLAQIEQAGMNDLNAYVPQLMQTISQENQQQLSNLMNLLNMYQSEDQRLFQNQLSQRQQEFYEAMQKREYNLAVDKWIFNRDLAIRQQQTQEQYQALQGALSRLDAIGYVASQEDAQLLGVPVGTQSSAAREAAANRALQLQIHEASLRAQEKAEKANNFSQLMQIWQATGQAPSGLEEFGVQPGQSLYQTPTETLQDMVAMSELTRLQQEQEMQAQIPEIQSRFGVDDITAQAIYKVWENPSLEAALADYQSSLGALQEAGVDTTKVRQAIDAKFRVDTVAGSTPYPIAEYPGVDWNAIGLGPLNTGISLGQIGTGLQTLLQAMSNSLIR